MKGVIIINIVSEHNLRIKLYKINNIYLYIISFIYYLMSNS